MDGGEGEDNLGAGQARQRFVPKMPPRRKRVVKEEDTELLNMMQAGDDAAAAALASRPATIMPFGQAMAQFGGAPSTYGSGMPGAGARDQIGTVSFRHMPKDPFGSGGLQSQQRDENAWLLDQDAPIVLPFTRARVDGSASHAAAQFPRGSAAAMLLEGGDGALASGMLFFQLPPDLPTNAALGLGGAVPAPKDVDSAVHPREFANRCKELGDGSLGKLRLHKSGRITIQMGDVPYEVFAGTDCACAQQLVALSHDKCCALADVRGRMLCVPSIAALTAAVHTAPAAMGGMAGGYGSGLRRGGMAGAS